MAAASWTEKEDALLVKLRAEGVSSVHIAVRLLKSRSAVIGRANRLGLCTPRDPNPVDRPKRPRGRPQTRPTGTHLPGHNRPKRAISPCYVKPLAADEPKPVGGSLLNLGRGQCHWPHGDGPFTFCGHPVERVGSDHPYCVYHNAVSFRPRGSND